MKYYDNKKIGRLISAGSEHVIFEYGDNKVIKYSIVNILIGRKNGLERASSELRLCKKYFGDYILDTEIRLSKKHRFVVEIQPKIQQRYLTISDMRNPLIRTQFMEIVQRYNELVAKEKMQFDLTGQAGLFKPRLSNIFILDNNKLQIIDATLLNDAKPYWLRVFVAAIRVILMPIQKHRIDQFIKYKL